MEKLIQYLNEYEDGMVSWVKEYSEEFGVFILNTEQMIEEEIIISKSFGFIKRLVENKKINRHNVKETNYGWEFNYYWTIPNSKRNKEIQVERLLMLLSIQDNPIEFLVSILK